MGTPDFAVPALNILVENGYDVAAVITATDKRGGRGNKKILQSAVKKYALKKGLNVLQPKNLRAPEFVEELKKLEADLQVVVAFRMLPKIVWAMPRYGTFNLHGSLLPRYRGAAPINWSIINGDKETGVTSFFIQQEIDTGDLLFQENMPIGENDTAGIIHDRMMILGAEVVLKTVQAIEKDEYDLQKQDDSLATKAPKIYRETCEINFDQTTEKVHNFIRGLSPYPAAWTTLDGLQLKILKTTKDLQSHELKAGTIVSDNKKEIKIATQDGFVQVHELQLQGKKRLKTRDFLNGFSFSI